MPARRFASCEEALAFLNEHPQKAIARTFCGVYEVATQEVADDCEVPGPGYYLGRLDLARLLSPRHYLVRDMEGLRCHEPRPPEEHCLDGYAALEDCP